MNGAAGRPQPLGTMEPQKFAQKAVNSLGYTLRSAPSQSTPARAVDLYFGSKIFRLYSGILSLCDNGFVEVGEIVMRSVIEHWITMMYIQQEGDEAAERFMASDPQERQDLAQRARRAPVGDQDAAFAEALTAHTKMLQEAAEWVGLDPEEFAKGWSRTAPNFIERAKAVGEETDREAVHVLVQNWLLYTKGVHPTPLGMSGYIDSAGTSCRARTTGAPDANERSRHMLSGVGILCLETAKRMNSRLGAGATPQLREVENEVKRIVAEVKAQSADQDGPQPTLPSNPCADF